jgi:hypothetical protein
MAEPAIELIAPDGVLASTAGFTIGRRVTPLPTSTAWS